MALKTPVSLSELAVAVYLYECFTGYDKSYFELVNQAGTACALDQLAIRKALIKWLNRWGCRQFALKHHNLASRELLKWYQIFVQTLPSARTNLWQLTERDLDNLADMFSALAGARASIRSYKNRKHTVTVGRTGAAKILFALRPKVFPPWDDPIRKRGGYTGRNGYIQFLKDTRAVVLDLKRQCTRNNISIEALPKKINRPRSSVPKLIDEYYWVTITNGCRLPSVKTLEGWASWK